MNANTGIIYPLVPSTDGLLYIKINHPENDSAEFICLNTYIINSTISKDPPNSVTMGQTKPTIMQSNLSKLSFTIPCRKDGLQVPYISIVELGSSSKEANSGSGDLLPTLVGGALTLIGGIIAAIWTSRNEAKRAQFEWGKFLFEHYEKSYRDFMTGLRGTINANLIKDYSKRLNDSAFVPGYLRTKVMETIWMLESNIEESEKKAARDNLLIDFERFMQEPWELGPKQ